MSDSTPLLAAAGLCKAYRKHKIEVRATNPEGLTSPVAVQELVVQALPSGSAKLDQFLASLEDYAEPALGQAMGFARQLSHVGAQRFDGLHERPVAIQNDVAPMFAAILQEGQSGQRSQLDQNGF